MRQYKRESSPQFYIAVMIVGGLFAYTVLKGLADIIGVDVGATLNLVVGIVCALVFFGCGLWSQITDSWPLTVANVTPIALATLVMGFSATLQQLGTNGPMWLDGRPVTWWGSPYTHYGVALSILLFGYGYLYLRRD